MPFSNESPPGMTPGAWGRMPDDARLVALLAVLCFFCVGLPRIFTGTAAFTLFLTVYDAELLPVIYLGAAVAAPALGFLFLHLRRRMSALGFVALTLIIDLATLLALRVGLSHGDAGWLVIAAAIWVEVEWVLGGLVFWGLAERVLDRRRARRLSGVIGAGGPAAMVLGGLTVPVLLTAVETADLLWFSAGSIAVATAVAGYLAARCADRPEEPTAEAPVSESLENAHAGEQRTRRFVLAIAALVIVAEAGHLFVDNAFFDRAETRFPDERQLAGFLGLFYAVVGALTLALRTVVADWLIGRRGMLPALLALPVLVLLGSASVVGVDWTLASAGAVFWLAVVTKLADESLRAAVYGPALLALYQPLPAKQRPRAQTWTGGRVEFMATAGAGAVLLLFNVWLGFDAADLFAAVVVIGVAWVAVALLVRRAYMAMLVQALAKRRFADEEPSLSGRESLSVLQRALESPHPAEAIYAMRLMEGLGARSPQQFLEPLLRHPEAAVRRAALTRIEVLRPDGMGPLLAPLLTTESDPQTRGALLRALASLGETEAAVEAIDRPAETDDVVRLGALVGLMRHGGIDGVVAAGRRFLVLVGSPDANDRLLAVRVLEELGTPQVSPLLMSALEDPEPAVRQAALRVAAAVNTPQLRPLLIGALQAPALRPAASRALAAAGEAAIADLEDVYAVPGAAWDLRAAVVAILGRIGREHGVASLVGKLAAADPRIRHQVLLALRQCRYRPVPADQGPVWQAVARLAGDAARCMAAMGDLGAAEGASVLRRALAYELDRCREGVFLLLSFVYDERTLMQAWLHYAFGTFERKGYALEIIDALLPADQRPTVMPVLEVAPSIQRRWAIAQSFGEQMLGADRRLALLAQGSHGRTSPWTRCCAVYALGWRGSTTGDDAIDASLHADEAPVRETARWALARRRAYAEGSPSTEETGHAGPVEARARTVGVAAGKGTGMLLTIEKVLILKTVGIFSEVPDEILAEVASLLQPVDVPAGEIVIREGEVGGTLYIVVDGRVRVRQDNRTIIELGEREVFGELAALDPAPRSATVDTVEDSRLFELRNDHLEQLMASNPGIVRGIMRMLCRRLRTTTAGVADWAS